MYNMSSSNSRHPDPCEECGSRRYRVGDDGYTYCHRGHQQTQRGTVITEDTGELIIRGRTTRRRDSDAESIASKASGFHGPRAFEHYLLCLQLILRKQLRWLVEVRKLPEELEAVVRDLWSLRLQKLQSRVSYDSETDTEAQSHAFSSHSEGETSASETSRRSPRRNRTKADGSPGITDCLSLCYIGTLLLREPVTVADIYTWASNGELLYFEASKEVPLGMRDRLPATYQELLEPQALGKPERLHQDVLKLLSMFSSDFGMAVAPINHTVVLYRWMHDLAIPIEIFAATQRLAGTLSIGFQFQLDIQAGPKDVVLRFPEARLMALVIIATKLLFPFDNVKRSPRSASDLAALSMDWSVWAESESQAPRDQKSLSFQDALHFTEADALGAADDQLDQYMDWYEQNIASEDIRERGKAGKDADFRRALFGFFPASRSRPDADRVQPENDVVALGQTEHLRRVQNSLTPGRIADSRRDQVDVQQAGSLYRRYRTVRDVGGAAMALHQRAASLAGLSLEAMVRAVYLVETRIRKHEECLRAKDKGY